MLIEVGAVDDDGVAINRTIPAGSKFAKGWWTRLTTACAHRGEALERSAEDFSDNDLVEANTGAFRTIAEH